jgi:hypothetical protein
LGVEMLTIVALPASEAGGGSQPCAPPNQPSRGASLPLGAYLLCETCSKIQCMKAMSVCHTALIAFIEHVQMNVST